MRVLSLVYRFLTALPFMFGLVGTAQAQKALGVTGNAKPIAAWTDFCNRHPAECAVDTTQPDEIKLTTATRSTLMAITKRVNAKVKPLSDQIHWGMVDHWDFPDDNFGDCEDYQLLKRRILVERYGFPRRALRMTVVIDEVGEGHAVLMVRTDQGDLILDNKNTQVLPWWQTPYTYVKRESQDSVAWQSLGGIVGTPAVAAAIPR